MRGQFLPATKDGLGFLDLKKMNSEYLFIKMEEGRGHDPHTWS